MIKLIPKKPYLPWSIESSEFPKNGDLESIAKYILRYAILAPSSHNTQPWKFKVNKNCIRMYPDYKRSLPYSDRLYREQFISIGCALANYLVASDFFNISTEVSYLPEDDLYDSAVEIIIKKTNRVSRYNNLFPYITRRKTNRNIPTGEPINQKALQYMSEYKDDKDINVHFIENDSQKKRIADIMYMAILNAFSDKMFKFELSHWIRSVYTRENDGIPLFDADLPSLLTLLAPLLIQNAPAKNQAVLDRMLVAKSPVLLVISGVNNDKITWLKVGKIFELMALQGAEYDVTFAPMAGIIEQDESNELLQEAVKISGKPLFFARLCHPRKEIHQSPRRGLEEMLI